MKRKINFYQHSTKLIFLSIILTLLFFLIGIYLGIRIYDYLYSKEMLPKIEKIYLQAKELNKEIESVKEILILDFFNLELKCQLIEKTIKNVRDYSFNVLAKKLPYRLEEYEFFNRPSKEYLSLKNEYMKMMVSSFFLTIKYKSECNKDIITLLYFYSSDCGPKCIEQGKELDKLRELENEELSSKIYFFILDKEWNLNEIKILKELYGIKEVPSLLINEKILLSGFHNISSIIFISSS